MTFDALVKSRKSPPSCQGKFLMRYNDYDKILLSNRQNIGKFRLYVNIFLPQDVVLVRGVMKQEGKLLARTSIKIPRRNLPNVEGKAYKRQQSVRKLQPSVFSLNT